ncbi:MAG: hypothetical protein ACHRHE_01140 [Tepidisphaerales bacterium]
MRRPARHIFTIARALSLLLCGAACGLWVRSYWLSDRLSWPSVRGWRSVYSAQGYVVVSLYVGDLSGRPADFYGPRYKRGDIGWPGNYLLDLDPDTGDTRISWKWGGFAWYEIRKPGGGIRHAQAVVPFWCIGMATALPPLGWTTLRWRSRVRVRRRKRLGLCPACGYDLRATPGRCPECGAMGAK